jgi:hypothetical protein
MLRSIQAAEYVCDPARLICPDFALVSLEKTFQTAVPERPDQQDTVPCIGRDVKGESGLDVELRVVGAVEFLEFFQPLFAGFIWRETPVLAVIVPVVGI